jgi:hypothetical protein
MIKKAAMFGFDARIALAIFGALSVSSGAALYSAIQNAKVTATLTELKEVEKAVAQYILDTGIDMPLATVSGQEIGELSAYALLEKPSGVTNWNGPYLSYTKDATYDFLVNSNNNNIAVAYRKSGDWGSYATNDLICKRSYTTCHVWIGGKDFALDTMKELEKRIDGTTTPGATDYNGNFNYNGTWFFLKTDIPFPPALSNNA